MGLKNIYKTLFDIRILHRFFLNEGADAYVESGGGALQEQFDANRLKYNLSDFMTIQPTQRTVKMLKNYHGVFRQYKDGIKVALKQVPYPDPLPDPLPPADPFIAFDDDFFLDFTIEINDQYFENYTDIDWDKNGLIYLSNKTPTGNYTPTLENEPPAVPVDFSLLSSYQTDVPGSSYDLNLLKDITARELQNKFGVIRVHLVGDVGEIRLTDPDPGNETKFNTTTPELDIYLKNRSVFWRFKDAEDLTTVLYTTTTVQPLTANGFLRMPPASEALEDRYPNPDGKVLVWESPDYYAEVFVNTLVEPI